MATRDVAVIVGSLRKGSFNRKMAHALAALAPPSLKLEIVEIGALPLYNQDDEATCRRRRGRRSASACRRPMRCCSSRPNTTARSRRCSRTRSTSARAPMARARGTASRRRSMSVSPGAIGGFGANHHLRQSLVFLNVPTLQQPEAYIGGAGEAVRRRGQADQSRHRGFPDEVHAGLRRDDREGARLSAWKMSC